MIDDYPRSALAGEFTGERLTAVTHYRPD